MFSFQLRKKLGQCAHGLKRALEVKARRYLPLAFWDLKGINTSLLHWEGLNQSLPKRRRAVVDWLSKTNTQVLILMKKFFLQQRGWARPYDLLTQLPHWGFMSVNWRICFICSPASLWVHLCGHLGSDLLGCHFSCCHENISQLGLHLLHLWQHHWPKGCHMSGIFLESPLPVLVQLQLTFPVPHPLPILLMSLFHSPWQGLWDPSLDNRRHLLTWTQWLGWAGHRAQEDNEGPPRSSPTQESEEILSSSSIICHRKNAGQNWLCSSSSEKNEDNTQKIQIQRPGWSDLSSRFSLCLKSKGTLEFSFIRASHSLVCLS